MSANDVQQIIDKYGRPVFEAAVRQVYINSILEVAWAAILLVVAGIAWRLARKSWAVSKSVKAADHYADEMGWQMGAAGSYLTAAIAVFVAIGLLTDASGAVLNPTWKAVEIILRAVKG